MMRLIMLVLALAQTSLADAQDKRSQDKRATVVTNGELTAGKEFHLLLIHDGTQFSQHVAAMLTTPRAHMVNWAQSANVRLMHVNEPQVTEHHQDLIDKHQGQLPILAFIQQTADDGRGAVWCSAAGGQIATDEYAMASWLGRYYQATANAAMQSNPLAVVAGPRNLEMQTANNGSYFLPRSNGAPPAYQPSGRRPLFNPQVDVAVPDAINTAVGLNPDTIWAGVGAAVVAIVCCLILSHGRVQSANIHANAITHEPGKLTDDGDD